MRSLARAVAILILLWCAQPLLASAQDQKATGTITGRVTVDDKPARDTTVIATPVITDPAKIVESVVNKPTSLKATTDSDGHYSFESVPAGKYTLAPFAPTMVTNSGDSGKEVTVTSEAAIEGIDFSLSQGGVITGRVTDNEGRPVILERITLKPADSPPSAMLSGMINSFVGGNRMYATDDRGVYRIFGLRPGRYLVSSGSANDMLSAMFKFRPNRTQTFYPGVTDESKAKPVQVTAGAEVGGIDIQFSAADKGFIASGRVVDAETGTAIPRTMVAYSPTRRTSNKVDDGDSEDDNQSRISNLSGIGITTTNDKGEFRFESVAPGKYTIEIQQIGMVTGLGTSEYFGDPVNIEVRSGNVDRIEVKAHRGASISGVAVIEGGDKQTDVQSFGRVMLAASVNDEQTKTYSSGAGVIAADGTFRIGGLKPGKATIRVFSLGGTTAALLRIERNGEEVQEGIDIQGNEQISGVRVVLTTADCIIKGHVTIEGGTLPPGVGVIANAHRVGGETNFLSSAETAQADANGDFVIENLAPATYEVQVSVNLPSRAGMRNVTAKQTVTTTSSAPGFVSLTLNVKGKAGDR